MRKDCNLVCVNDSKGSFWSNANVDFILPVALTYRMRCGMASLSVRVKVFVERGVMSV